MSSTPLNEFKTQIMQAWLEGKQIQFCYNRFDKDWINIEDYKPEGMGDAAEYPVGQIAAILIDLTNDGIRVKPEPVITYKYQAIRSDGVILDKVMGSIAHLTDHYSFAKAFDVIRTTYEDGKYKTTEVLYAKGS